MSNNSIHKTYIILMLFISHYHKSTTHHKSRTYLINRQVYITSSFINHSSHLIIHLIIQVKDHQSMPITKYHIQSHIPNATNVTNLMSCHPRHNYMHAVPFTSYQDKHISRSPHFQFQVMKDSPQVFSVSSHEGLTTNIFSFKS